MLIANAISTALTATIVVSTCRGRGSDRHSAAPATATASISRIDCSASTLSALQRAEPIDVDRPEFAVDVIDRDAHHEDADKSVEQHPQFDQQRCADNGDHAEDKDPVLQHQVADDLHQRVAPADDQEQADRIRKIDESSITKRSEEHTSELQSLAYLVCRLLLEKKKITQRACQQLNQ